MFSYRSKKSVFVDITLISYLKLCHMKQKFVTYEPSNDKTYKMACAPSEDSDQPVHLLNLRVFAVCPTFLHAESKDTDQTGQMPRLICLC